MRLFYRHLKNNNKSLHARNNSVTTRHFQYTMCVWIVFCGKTRHTHRLAIHNVSKLMFRPKHFQDENGVEMVWKSKPKKNQSTKSVNGHSKQYFKGSATKTNEMPHSYLSETFLPAETNVRFALLMNSAHITIIGHYWCETVSIFILKMIYFIFHQ